MPKFKFPNCKGLLNGNNCTFVQIMEKFTNFGQKNAIGTPNGNFDMKYFSTDYLTITPSTKRIGTSSISDSLMLLALKMNFLSYKVPSIK